LATEAVVAEVVEKEVQGWAQAEPESALVAEDSETDSEMDSETDSDLGKAMGSG
jgi:hypothetical protein